MEFHLEYGLRLNTEPKHKNLYSWAINEIGADGSPINRDQIPWVWTLYFTAMECVLTNRHEIEPPFRLEEADRNPPNIKTDQVIRMTLHPGTRRSGELSALRDKVKFSMFGTSRAIQTFTLEIRPLEDSEEAECCKAWGSSAYTTEIDFRDELVDDCICFYLSVKPETFAHYVALIEQNAVDDITFSVSYVDGFYSDWRPTITTNEIKVLLTGKEHKFDLPSEFQGNLPRLGSVRGSQLLLQRRLQLNKAPLSPSVTSEQADDESLAVTSSPDTTLRVPLEAGYPRLLPLLASLKKAMRIIVMLLAAIAIIEFLKH